MADDVFSVALALDAGPAAPAVGVAVGMFRSILDVLRQAREESEQFARSTTEIRDALRDVRALSGKGGVDDAFLRTHLEFIKQTGMTKTESHDFVEQFLGEAESFRGKMDPKQFEQLQTLSAQYAVAVGGDVGTRAKLAGRLLGMGPEGRGATDVLGEMAEVNRLLGLGSGKTDLLTKSYLNAAASMLSEGGTGAVGSSRNLAALAMGASRLGGEFTVDTTLEQFGKAVQGFGPDAWQKFVKKDLGVQEGTKVEQAMIPMFKWMEQQQAGGRDLNAALQEQGLDRVEMRRALIGMFNQRQSIMTELAGQGGQVSTPQAAMQQIADAFSSTEGRARLAEGQVTAAETEVGMRFENANIYRRKAYAELLKTGELGPEATAANVLTGLMSKAVGTTREELLIDKKATEIYQRDTGRKINQVDPTMLESAVGGLFDLFIAPQGEHDKEMTGDTARGIAQWRSGQAGGLQQGMMESEDARKVGDWGNVLIAGPQGMMTYSQFESMYRSQGKTDAEIKGLMAHVLERIQAERARPMAVPGASRGVTK